MASNRQGANALNGDEIFVHFEERREILVRPDTRVTFDLVQYAWADHPAISEGWKGVSFDIFCDLRHIADGSHFYMLKPDLGSILLTLDQDVVHDGHGWRNPTCRNLRLIEADKFAAMRAEVRAEGAR